MVLGGVGDPDFLHVNVIVQCHLVEGSISGHKIHHGHHKSGRKNPSIWMSSLKVEKIKMERRKRRMEKREWRGS